MKTSLTKHIIRIDQRSSHKANVSTASLLSRLGAHAAARFSSRLARLELAPVHAGILGTVAVAPGISQSALARVLGTLPSRMVTYLDELEGKGLLERRPHKNDRRNNSLYLTKAGQAAYHSTSRLAEEHQQALLAGLSRQQQMQLAALLERVADQQGLIATPRAREERRKGAGAPGKHRVSPQCKQSGAPSWPKARVGFCSDAAITVHTTLSS